MVRWLRLCTSIAGSVGSIPGWGTKISLPAVKKKERERVRDEEEEIAQHQGKKERVGNPVV